jgi:hypothetical protein
MSEGSEGDDRNGPQRGRRGAHLTPDLPPVIEAPELRGAAHTRPEDSPVGRKAPLPPPYGERRPSA